MSTHLKRLSAVLGATLAALFLACWPAPAVQDTQLRDPKSNVAFGLPGKASKNEDNKEAYLIERPQYVLSYNDKTKNPNWVSWQLTKDDLGKAKRTAFEPDPLLPKGFVHITTKPYTNTGFDRGHMCPAADRSSSEENMKGTFFMTNIIPQAPNLNRKGWERMEDYCRNLARQGKELHICCGPSGTGGVGSMGDAKTIGSGRGIINVPAKCWKVVMVLPKGEKPNKDTRTFAVIVKNDESGEIQWPKWRVSVQDVEKLTGLSFWPELPKAVGTAIKARTDDTNIKVKAFKAGTGE